jgi:Transmembrane protein 65
LIFKANQSRIKKPSARIELTTFRLLSECSTAKLRGRSAFLGNVGMASASFFSRTHPFFISFFPSLCFGFIDNTIMIRAGSWIDRTIGERYQLHTLNAAALGQTLSDTVGVTATSLLAAIALKRINVSSVVGASLGVASGCCLGMLNLYSMDLENRSANHIENEILVGLKQKLGCQECQVIAQDSEIDVPIKSVSSTGQHMIRIALKSQGKCLVIERDRDFSDTELRMADLTASHLAIVMES